MDEYESEEELGDAYPSSHSKQSVPSHGTRKATHSKTSAGPKVSYAGGKKGVPKRDDAAGDFLGMRDYMDAMDRELAKTSIGKSFVKQGDTVRFVLGCSLCSLGCLF
jgi:hypothetical protein